MVYIIVLEYVVWKHWSYKSHIGVVINYENTFKSMEIIHIITRLMD